MVMSATIPAYQANNSGLGAQIDNAFGTAEKDIYAYGSNGGICEEIRCHSGPTTAPGTGNIILKFYNNAAATSRIIGVFPLVNTADTQQFIMGFPALRGLSGDKIRAQVRTALPSGASLDFFAVGRDL